VTTLGEALRAGTERLLAAGSETARLDAELLLAHALETDRTAVLAHPEAPLGPAQVAAYESELARRSAGEPVAYIRGLKEFYGLAFGVDARALIPRPDTELLVDLGISRAVAALTGMWRRASGPLRVVDVGTGAGAVAVAFTVTLRRRGYGRVLDVLATDASAEALALATENAVVHGAADLVRFRQADLLPADEPPFELVLANLPYVPSEEVDRLPVAASFEPRAALDGGPDGLGAIGRLLALLPSRLAEDGSAFVEIGAHQVASVERLADEMLPGWGASVHLDLGGEPRVMEARRAG